MRKIAYILVALSLALSLTDCRRGSQAPADIAEDSVSAAVRGSEGGRRARRKAEKQMAEAVEKVEFKGLEKFTLHGMSGVDLEVRVVNNTNVKLAVERLDMTFRLDGRPLASVTLSQAVELARRSESVVLVPLRIRIDNPLTILSALSAFNSDPSRITVSGKGTVKAGGLVRKSVEIREVPLGDLMKKMGVSKEDILKNINL